MTLNVDLSKRETIYLFLTFIGYSPHIHAIPDVKNTIFSKSFGHGDLHRLAMSQKRVKHLQAKHQHK